MSLCKINFFKCLICHSYFEDVWKAQKHVDQGEHDKKNGNGPCNYSKKLGNDKVPVRRRGMLPIEKVSFPDCFVPLIKVQTNGLETAPDTMQNKRTRRKTPVNYVTAFEDEGTDAEITAKNRKGQGQNTCPLPTCNSTHPSYAILSYHLRKHILAEREELVRNSDQPSEQPIHFSQKNPRNPKIIQCKFCLRKERSVKALKCHQIKVHAQQRKLKCLHCDQRGFDECVIAFIGHIKTCHPKELGPNNERFGIEKPKRPKNFKCGQCRYSCIRQEELIRHVERVHQRKKQGGNSSKSKFSCPVCRRVCCSRESLNRHFHLHLENNPFTCNFPNCNRKFTSHYSLRKHQLLHDEAHVKASQQKCHICGATYAKKQTLDKHLRVFHNASNLKAGRCNLPHLRRSDLEMSNKANGNKMPTLCPPATLNQNKSNGASRPMPVLTPILNPHEISNDDDDTSDNCDSVPILESRVKYEPGCQSSKGGSIKVEAENTGEEINLVDRIILKEDGTAVHIKGEHLSPETKASPESRDKPPINVSFENTPSEIHKPSTKYSPFDVIAKDPAFQKIAKTDPSALNKLFSAEHINRTGKYFTCNECQGVFNRAWTLQLHMRTQHKKTIVGEFLVNNSDSQGQSIVLMCALCAYPAESKEDLATHMESHKNPDRIFKCKTKGCEQDFDSQGKLTSHINWSHPSGQDGNFTCDYCDKTFMTHRLMKRHEYKVHWTKSIGDKRNCPVCNAAITPKRFSEHAKKHKEEAGVAEKPKCMLCQDSFSCRMALQRHIDCVHLGKPLNKIRHANAKKKKVAEALKRKMDKGKGVNEWDSRMKDVKITDSDPGDEVVRKTTVPVNFGEDSYTQNCAGSEEMESMTILGP